METNMSSSSPFQSVGIMGRVRNDGIKDTLKALIAYLRHLNQTFYVDSETAAALNEPDLPAVAREQFSEFTDLIIVVGGDGGLLHAAQTAVEQNLPILGINRGRLGFLTDIIPCELDKIADILKGKYNLEHRFLLETTIENNGEILGQDNALNEIAVIPDTVPHMIEFEIYIDNQFVCSQNSDGLIIATPTGSTAYALSGGGPILHPKLDAIVLVPMFPHTLSSRPIVVEGNSKLSILISPNNSTSPRLSCDGRAYLNTPPGGKISINKKAQPLQLVHPIDYDYYEALRSKLHWGNKLNYRE
jgi:NAD+ kinase